MPQCASCGNEMEEGHNFCPTCGTSVQSTAIAAMIHDAREALSTNPDDISARYNLAIAYKLGGMEDMALQELGRVAELQPDFADVHFELGLLHAKGGRKQEAISSLTLARDLDPGDDRASRLLAKLTGAA